MKCVLRSRVADEKPAADETPSGGTVQFFFRIDCDDVRRELEDGKLHAFVEAARLTRDCPFAPEPDLWGE